MKYIFVLGLLAFCAIGSSVALVVPPTNAKGPVAVIPTPPPAPTMAQDLDEIMRMVNFLQLRQLMTRYLLNDAQFQSFVRIINSQDSFITQMRFRSQPEVIAFTNWVNAQILASGGELVLEESEEFMTIFNPTPFWSNTVSGWQGFVNEFMFYFPADMINAHVTMKAAQNGIFTQFVQRLKALKPVYDRVIVLPEAQRLAAALQLNGIDIIQLDDFIRNLFGWQMPPTLPPTTTTTTTTSTTTTTTTTAAPVSSSTEAVISSTASAVVDPVVSSSTEAAAASSTTSAPVVVDPVVSSSTEAAAASSTTSAPVVVDPVVSSSTEAAVASSTTSAPVVVEPSVEPSVAVPVAPVA